MRFGFNTDLVNEIIDYARSGELFFADTLPDPTNQIVIEHDFRVAIDLAMSQDLDEEYAIWNDVRSIPFGKLLAQGRTAPELSKVVTTLPSLADELS